MSPTGSPTPGPHSPGPPTPGPHSPTPEAPFSRTRLLRWQVASGSFSVPQAAAPIAFALIALPLTGSAESGAALVFAMTAAQVAGSVPVSRAGIRFNAVHYLRLLIGIRTLALAVVTVLAAVGAPFWSLFVAVIVAGLVNGSAHGYQRTLLNHLVAPGRLPRALGVAATLNEVSFALSPVLASVVGAVSPVWAMVGITVLGAGPILLLPSIPQARGLPPSEKRHSRTPLSGAVLLWLLCAGASGAAIAAIEVGAVSFALSFGLDPGWAFLFALALCIGSVAGGIWVSVRNRVPRPWKVVAFLTATSAGFGVVVAAGSVASTLAGAGVVGFFLPMLGTFYSLTLDELAPPHRRAEMFAHLRTASALGVMGVSALLAVLGLQAALLSSLGLLLVATALATVHACVRPARARRTGRKRQQVRTTECESPR